jgi:hypothetical protein
MKTRPIKLHLLNGQPLVVDIPDTEDALDRVLAGWQHGLTCIEEVHILKFDRLDGRTLFLSPAAILGVDEQAETVQ